MSSPSSGGAEYTQIEAFAKDFVSKKDVSSFFHPEGILLESTKKNDIAATLTPTSWAGILTSSQRAAWHLENVWLMNNSTACITIKFPNKNVAMVLLKSPRWKIISAMICQSAGKPADFSEVLQGAALYMSANRATDGEAMAQVFHPICRLTYAQDDGTVAVHSQSDFCSNIVEDRWNVEPYRSYAHLQEDPRVLDSDEVQAVTMLGPHHAIVKLNVGFPPLLYTDVLFFARVDGTWWIIAKSSVNEPFLADEAGWYNLQCLSDTVLFHCDDSLSSE